MFKTPLLRHTLLLVALLLFAVAVMAADEPQKPQLFKDWGRRCETPQGADKEVCYIFQRVNLKESGKTLLHITVGYPPKQKKSLMVLTLPLGVSLVPGVEVKVDEKGKVFRAPYNVCLPNGCRSVFGVDDNLMWALKAGNSLNIAFVNAQGKVLKLPVSLKGFTSAVKTIQK